MPGSDLPNDYAIGRRSFLASTAAWTLPAWLLNCRQAPADAAQAREGPLLAADFRRPGLSDREVLTRAFAAWTARGSGTLHLERNRVYDLGVHPDASNVFVVFGLVNAVLAGNGATLRLRSTAQGNIVQIFNILYLAHYQNLRIENLTCVDTGYRDSGVYSYQQGGRFIVLDAGDRDSVDITLDNVAGEGLISFITMQGVPGGPRVRGVRIVPNCRATRVFYPLSCQNNGDDVTGGLTTLNCGRPYFPYGVAGHDLTLRVHHQGPAFGPIAECAIPIKCVGRATSGIRLDATFSGVMPWTGALVTLEHQHDPSAGPSVIQDVDLRINIEPGTADPNNLPRLVLRSLLLNADQEVGQTSNIWRRIRLGGNLRPGRGPTILSRVLPTLPSEITIEPGTAGADERNISAPGFRIRRTR